VPKITFSWYLQFAFHEILPPKLARKSCFVSKSCPPSYFPPKNCPINEKVGHRCSKLIYFDTFENVKLEQILLNQLDELLTSCEKDRILVCHRYILDAITEKSKRQL
jgi:hypothetical protein